MKNVDEFDLDVGDVGLATGVLPPLPRVGVDELSGFEGNGEAPVIRVAVGDPGLINEGVEGALKLGEFAEDGGGENVGTRASDGGSSSGHFFVVCVVAY